MGNGLLHGTARRMLLPAMLLVPLVLAACAGESDSNPSERAGTDTNRIAINVGYQPLYAEAWSAVVVKQLELWKSYLPAGYEVDITWNSAATGAIVVNGMVGSKYDVGYTGDMPSINAMAQSGTKIVGTSTTWSDGQQCGLIAVPQESDINSVKDLEGKTIAVPVGSCLHFFLLNMLNDEDLLDKVTVENVSPDAIQAGFKSGGFDAGVLQEPLTSSVVESGDARVLATGATYESIDASNVLMTHDFYYGTGEWSSTRKVDGVSELAIAWQKANLAALNVMATEQAKTVAAVAAEIPEFPESVIESAIFTPVSINPEVKRLHLDPDWRGSPAGELLLESGPDFLQGLDAAEGFDKDSAMQATSLELAAQQLAAEGMSWPVVAQVGSGRTLDELALPAG